MKELNIKVGDLYNFVISQGGKPEENDSLFIEVPFKLEIKDEYGNWIPSKCVYKKQDALYEIKFEHNGKEKIGKYAGEHIFPFDLQKEVSSYAKDLQIGDVLPNNFKVTSVEKIADLSDVYSPEAESYTHHYQDCDGLIHHNTYSVKQAVKNEFSKGGLAHKGYNVNMKSGDIGRSISALVAFFYSNRQKQVIILDDCDGFVLNKDQTVQNLLKALLDLDNTEKNPKYVSVAPAIQDLATKYLGQVNKKKKEGVVISIDHEKLRENLLSVAVDGVTVGQSLISNEEKRMFKPVIHESVENDDYDYDCLEEGKNLDAFIAAGGDPNSEDADMAAEMDENENLINDGNDDDTVPEEFRFTSRLIMISNLKKSDVNDAVLSRTLSYDMELTKDEFLAHLGDILPNLITDVETEDPDWMIQYAKKVAYAYLIAAVDIDNAGGSVQGVRCKITIPLQFRIIAELAGKWCMRANRFITKNNLDYSEKSLPKVDKAIRSMFFVRDVIPSLQA